jgi:diguanylate cyclase (GGDEF)-like protein/PAS domain S-box-containing protein
MHWLFTPAAGILFSATALAFIAAGMMWNRRSVPGGILLFLLMLGVAEYTLASGLEAASVTLFWKTLWAKLQYVGSGAVSTLLLLFATQYTGHDSWLRGWRRCAVWIVPIANVAAVSTNELHHWIWTGFSPGAVGTNTLVYFHGSGFYVAVGALYAYLGVACSLLIGAAARPVVIRRRQSITVLLGTAFPLAAGCLYIAGITPLAGLDLVPIACLLSAAVLIASVGAFRVFDLLPIARDALVEEMSDAVLVVDGGRRLVDLNPAARRLLGLDSTAIGRRAADAIPAWQEIETRCCQDRRGLAELALRAEPPLFADVRVSRLLDRDRRASGFLVVLRDITARHAAEAELQDANRRLESHVERIEALQTKLREQAIRDALTGLCNRRYLDETLPRIIERSSYGHSAFSAVMLDIDHFKQVNDRYGHEEGDRVLEALGRLLRERTRPGDIACRYGGEEFVLILPDASLTVALARAEELLVAFRELSRERGHPVTLSAGVAAFPTHGQTEDELLRAADEALYAAKLAGRDCVRVPS